MRQTRHSHTADAIARRLRQEPKVDYLREWVYGGIDGVVTTFAVVAGVAGADLSTTVMIIIALAGLFGDGFSMAAGCFSSTKADEDAYERLRRYETESVETEPAGETEEVRQIFRSKGFDGDVLEKIVSTITANKQLWIETMMVEEYGLSRSRHKAWPAAYNTFFAFLICGAMPLLPFLVGAGGAVYYSACFSGLTFFLIGSMKSLWSHKTWWREGMETLAIGSVAAVIAFMTGYMLKTVLL